MGLVNMVYGAAVQAQSWQVNVLHSTGLAVVGSIAGEISATRSRLDSFESRPVVLYCRSTVWHALGRGTNET